MKRDTVIFFLPVVFLMLAGCAGKSERSKARPTEHKSFSQRLNQDNGYKQDASGNWVPKSDQRSSFESVGESPYFKGKQKKKEFKTDEYQSKSFWGNRDFKVKSYQGDTDGSRFQTAARQQGMTAREGGNATEMPGEYATRGYATSQARETGEREAASHVVDAETEARRRVFQAPDVLNWNQRRAMSQEETKSLLGR